MIKFFSILFFVASTINLLMSQSLQSTVIDASSEMCTYPNSQILKVNPDRSSEGAVYKWIIAEKVIAEGSTFDFQTTSESSFNITLESYLNGEMAKTSKLIQVYRTPSLVLSGASVTVCGTEEQTVSVSDKFDYPINTINWYDEDGAVLSNNPSLTLPYGTNVTVVLSTNKCKSDSVETKIRYSNISIDSVGVSSYQVFQNSEVTLAASVLGQVDDFTFSWESQSSSITVGDNLVQNLSPEITDSYIFKAVGINSPCMFESDPVEVVVLSTEMIPNVFTPNDDGENDSWRIDGLVENSVGSITVLNRWGSTVFSHFGSYRDQFDGTFNGIELPIGTYYYIIRISKDLVVNGEIIIMR